MKTMTRSTIYVPMAAMILTGALAIPGAQTSVPFKGTFQGNDTVNFPTITQNDTGIGTHLGHFSSTALLTLGASGGTGTGQWIAANGDSIDTTVVASQGPLGEAPCQAVGAQPGDDYHKITRIHTIVGGTGRFAGVQGSFTVTRYHDTTSNPDGTHGTCGSYSGSMTPPGEAH